MPSPAVLRSPSAPPARVSSSLPSLSARLRDATREEHVAVETAFALDVRLAGREAYAGMLTDLRGFYVPAEAAVAAVAGWSRLTPAIEIRSRSRAALLDRDLKDLGIAVPCDGAQSLPPALPSLAHGLGSLYVLEGSALGGRVVARRARASMGDDLPVAFFSSAGRHDLGADWRALTAALDAFGVGRVAARRAVVDAARATFTALTAWLAEGRAR